MLKEKCNSMFCTKSGQTSKPKLTNGDILTALIWISVTRAKQASSPTIPKGTLSTLSCLVEIRSILYPKLGTYIGNAMMTTQCVLPTQSTSRKTTDPIADISFIHEVALEIRNEIRSITTEQATRYVSHINTLDDWSSFQAQWAELFSADPDNRLYQLSGYTTESEPSTGWVDVTLDYSNLTSYKIIPDAPIEQVMK
ncbi:uncharacterized protein AKAW2_60943S [Aspergillus luchuensis]|uniref:Uncharacterized protein n=1 Tax=Aspergillus kawachii TaxID=1069201 RepID=A0A7R7X5B4_ASPKA|nr:uncharacterized protein AKAW2_60943S [Aspergillus luchuensis]BCS02679.1 hypothetical protein AKAW2_60943S [Aspergillus luchuensis]BCS14339.1 hypothetical protein ALUC_60895S [Aspergillus luchuensis]